MEKLSFFSDLSLSDDITWITRNLIIFLVSSGGKFGDEQNMKMRTVGTYRVGHLGHIGPKVASRLW